MARIDLKPFTQLPGDDLRYDVTDVDVRDGYCWATDLSILVRCPQGDEPENHTEFFPNCGHIFVAERYHAGRCVEPFPAHSGATVPEKCTVCDGTGKGLVECSHCAGEGEIGRAHV